VVDEQSKFLKEAAENLDESDKKLSALQKQVTDMNHEVTLRNEVNSDLEKLVCKKEVEFVKLTSDNEFNKKRAESLQRQVVKLSMYNNVEVGNSSHTKEVKRLRALLEELDKKNDFLVSIVESEAIEKASLKTMLKTAYSEQEKEYKLKSGGSSQNAVDLWGAMNKTPAFMGYDIIFKLDKLVPRSSAGGRGEERKGSVVERMALGNDPPSSSSSAPVDPTLVQSQQPDSRVMQAVERLINGWSVQKLYSKHKPKGRVVRVDISTKSLFCLPLVTRDDSSSRGSNAGNKKGVLLSLINVILKDFDSAAKLKTSSYVEFSACMVCIELNGGECLILRLPTESERDDFYDGLTSLVVKYNTNYMSKLIKIMTREQYLSSLYLQAVIAHSCTLGEDVFEEVTDMSEADTDADAHVEDNNTSTTTNINTNIPRKTEKRKIITKKGSCTSASKMGSSSGGLSVTKMFSSNSARRLSVHNPAEDGTCTVNDEKSNVTASPGASNIQVVATQISSPPPSPSPSQTVHSVATAGPAADLITTAATAAIATPSVDEPEPTTTLPQYTPPAAQKVPSKSTISSFSKSSSLFSMLNKKDKEKHEVEINGIGNIYGSEKHEDRRHSINLSNPDEQGKRKTRYSFVSENPFAHELIPDESNTEQAANVKIEDPSKGNTSSRRSSLFACRSNVIKDKKVTNSSDLESDEGEGEGEGEDFSQAKGRGLSEVTIAKANLLSLSLCDDQANNTPPPPPPPTAAAAATPSTGSDFIEATKLSRLRSNNTPRRQSFATQSKPFSPISVGAENAKRFGMQQNSMRSNSGAQGIHERSSTSAPGLSSRTTLMTVDPESLEVLRQKAQRRSSASRELAAQTEMLKKKLSIKRDELARSASSRNKDIFSE
jgi:hypothetical protein